MSDLKTPASTRRRRSSQAEVERLLVASLPRRGRRLPALELKVELSLTALLALAVLALASTGAAPPLWPSLTALAMVGGYALASRVDYPIATGVAVPTQLFLVALFAQADARLVPLLVFAGLALGTAGSALAGRSRWDRLALCGADALYAVGPAVVLVAAGYTDATEAPWAVVALAFVAQCAVELVTSTVRDWLVAGVRPRIQLLVLGQVWLFDAALTPIGITAVATAELTSLQWVPLTLLPLVALVAYGARDRGRRIADLGNRLDSAERERERLQGAVKRIGDAFGSKLDLDSLLSILAGALVEALDADAGRARIVNAGSAHPSYFVEGKPAFTALLDRAEREALESGVLTAAGDGAGWALAAPVDPAGAVAVVSIARDGGPFSAAERELVGYLCLQAAVAAGDIARHHVLNRQALTDELTGVANHRSFQELLDAAFRGRRSSGATMSLILLDLDDFKLVNDRYGHQTGDRVLSAVGGCLLRHSRLNDEPARYGGEELAIVLPDTDLDQAVLLAERLRREIEALRLYGPLGEPLSVTASFGVASAGLGAPDKAALIAAADAALYEAKVSGKNCVCTAAAWSPHDRGATARRSARDFPSQVRRGLERGELVVYYQPKIEVAGRTPIGVEALLRWHHPELGLLAPARFLPWAEGTELMPSITRFVLRQTMVQASNWREAGLRLPVAVNIGAQDLADPRFPEQAMQVLRDAGASADELVFEITEHTAIAAEHHVGRALAELRQAGIRLSIDDFGSGHSSLSRLRDLDVDELKLDRELLRPHLGAADLAVLRAAVALGHDLELTVVAEGVETAENLEILDELGCDAAQGFHICPPLLPPELERWIARTGDLETRRFAPLDPAARAALSHRSF